MCASGSAKSPFNTGMESRREAATLDESMQHGNHSRVLRPPRTNQESAKASRLPRIWWPSPFLLSRCSIRWISWPGSRSTFRRRAATRFATTAGPRTRPAECVARRPRPRPRSRQARGVAVRCPRLRPPADAAKPGPCRSSGSTKSTRYGSPKCQGRMKVVALTFSHIRGLGFERKLAWVGGPAVLWEESNDRLARLRDSALHCGHGGRAEGGRAEGCRGAFPNAGVISGRPASRRRDTARSSSVGRA